MSEPGLLRSKRRINDFTAQVTVEEDHEDEVTPSDHPVERGARITDHAIIEPARLRLTVGWSNSGDGSRTQDDDFVRAVYARLLKLKDAREPFEVVTGKRLYSNMIVVSLSTTTTAETENSLIVLVGLREIFIVETQTVSVPPREVQAAPQETAATTDAGTKQAVPAKSANRSALKALVDG